MKNILLLLSTFIITFISCKKAENKIYYEGGNSPLLKASTSNVTLEPGQEANTAIVLNWTNPDYKFTTGVSSQDVTYTIEMDTSSSFNSSKKGTSVISKNLSKAFTVSELNSILGNDMQLQVDPRRNYTIQLRVKASIETAVVMTSNAISFTVRPFAPPPKVDPPASENLWVVGNAFSSGWSNPLPSPYDASQKFTKISKTLYQLTVPMVGGGGYKLLQEWAWGSQYHMVTGGWDSGTFEQKDSDPQFPGAPAAGNYKITIDFQLGKYTVVKL